MSNKIIVGIFALSFILSVLTGVAWARYEEELGTQTRNVYKVLLYCDCHQAVMEVSQDAPWIYNYTCIHCNQKVLYRRLIEQELDTHRPKRKL